MNHPAEILQFPRQLGREVRVNSWRWNELEDEALESLPPEIERLYLRGIRKHMDYGTGITGRKRRVSMDGFAELLNYYPPVGSKDSPRLYSRQQITRMIDKLEQAGLVERLHRGKGVKAPMEFRLPLACNDEDQHRAKSEQEGASQEKPRDNWSRTSNTEQGASKEERSTSGCPVPNTPSLRSGVVTSKKKSSPKKWGEQVDHDLAELMFSRTTEGLTNPKRPNMTAWATDIRLMRTKDQRTVEQIRYLINWVADDSFWSSNVMCPSKLREKWDALEKKVRTYKEARHANRQGSDQQRSERDRIAQRLADPNDDGWMDGLFEEDPASGAGEPDFYPAGSDLSEDMANGIQHGKHADSGEAGSGYIDGEVVNAADESGSGCSYRADQGRGRRVAAERGAAGQDAASKAGGFWNA